MLWYLVTLSHGCVQSGNCCSCPPGTRLGEKGTCEDPMCTPCGALEYTDVYNRLRRCIRQPYCDPNRNFDGSKDTIAYDQYECTDKNCPWIQTIRDRNGKMLFTGIRDTSIPNCSDVPVSPLSCAVCQDGDVILVICHNSLHPYNMEHSKGGTLTFRKHTPSQLYLYNQTTEYICECKTGFHCSSKYCITCIPHRICEEGFYPSFPGNHSHDAVCDPTPPTPPTPPNNWLLLLCVIPVLVMVIIIWTCIRKDRIESFGLATMCRGHCGTMCRTLYQCLTVQKEQPVTASHDETESLGTELSTQNSLSPSNECHQEGGVCVIRSCKLRKMWLVTISVTTLSFAVSIGLLHAVDRGMMAYCDSTVSVYTFPLGHSVTSQGLGRMEAISLSNFLNRCKQQNEFTVPGAVRFHKAIRCVRTNKYHKRGTSDDTSQTDSQGSKDSISGKAGASGSFLGLTASAESSFSKTEAVDKTVEKSVSASDNVIVSYITYQCEVGSVIFSDYTPSAALKRDIDMLNSDPHGQLDRFLTKWGYAFVSSITVGGYYSAFNIYSTCNKAAAESLDIATERCSEIGAKAEATGGTFGASVAMERVKCNTEGLSESHREALTQITKESQRFQIGGDNLGSETEWESTLKMNPYPLKMTITPITSIAGFTETATVLIKSQAENVRLSVAHFVEKIPDMTRRC